MLSKNILTTLAYYDIMDYPMTSFEIWKYLTAISNFQFPRLPKPGTGGQAISNKIQNNDEIKFSLQDVVKELDSDNLKKLIEEYRGFYFLKGRQSLVEQRIKRNKISESKYRILLRVASVLRLVPYVRMVAVTGRLAMKNADEKSDLDLLIALKHGKIFTGRILVTLIVHLLGKRRYKGKITNRVCLNYFITTKSLGIDLKDLYSASEYFFISPLFGLETFKEFQEKNSWIKNYKINYQEDGHVSQKILPDTYFTKLFRKTGEKLLNFIFIERTLKNWQIKRINRNPKTHQAGSLVTANDSALIFLPSPQGPKIYEKFQEQLSALI